jgi:monoterpene epsilon-lactone hydrolase
MCMSAKLQFRGPVRYRLRNLVGLGQSIFEVAARRLLKGPRRPSWNWFVEVVTQVLRRQVIAAFKMGGVEQARLYLDSVLITSPLMRAVNVTPVVQPNFRGRWFAPKDTQTTLTVLYLHGGGYSFYPRAYEYFIALITLAAKSRTFALNYRLTPEHRFPAQLEDAMSAYRWLLESGTDPDNLVIAGDSAGAHLALTLLLAIRDAKLPQPALGIALSPPTDADASNLRDQDSDWIDKAALRQWTDWFCDPAQRRDSLVSPLWADLHGLCAIYIQAGRAEILYDNIQAFADWGKNQGADIVLESWADMNHDFQMFGPDAPQSAEALRRIGEVIDARVRGPQGNAVAARVVL